MLPIINFDTSILPCAGEMDRIKRRSAKSTNGGGGSGGEWYGCSQHSILSAMDRFVRSVNNMHATVLVPSKLRDMEPMALKSSQHVPSALTNTDLHSFYMMLNNIKKELLWGSDATLSTSHGSLVMRSSSMRRTIDRSSSITSSCGLKHSRQSSDDSFGSMGSSASSASSSSASDTESEADSMITDRDSIDDQTSHLSVAFRHHLQGLNSILHQLADSADYLSSRYQEEVDSLL